MVSAFALLCPSDVKGRGRISRNWQQTGSEEDMLGDPGETEQRLINNTVATIPRQKAPGASHRTTTREKGNCWLPLQNSWRVLRVKCMCVT